MTERLSGMSDAARTELLERAAERGYVLASELDQLDDPLLRDRDNDDVGEEADDLGLTVIDDVAGAQDEDEPTGASPGYTEDPVRQYLNTAADHELLTAEDEMDLAKRFKAGRAARAMLADPSTRDELARQRLRALVLDGERAQDRLIRSNLRLVIPTAKRYAGRDLPMIEAIQEGNLGLMKAVEKFDHTKGYKFSTYAVWWIRQSIQRGLSARGRTIRVPTSIWEDSGKVRRAKATLRTDLGRDPTIEELASATGLKPDRIGEIDTALKPLTSLDLPVGEEGDTSLGTLIADRDAVDPSQSSEVADARARIVEALTSLPERERLIVELRYGLHDGEPHSYEEIGQVVGLTRERVRQIEKQAVRSLHDPAMQHGLQAVLETLAA